MNHIEEFGGKSYSFGTLPALEAIEVEVSIAKVIGEGAFKALMELDMNEVKSGKIDNKKMMELGGIAVGLITSKMDAADLVATMRKVLAYVTCDGQRIEINSHFTGKPKLVWQVFFHALRFNFSDFFPASLSGSLANLPLK